MSSKSGTGCRRRAARRLLTCELIASLTLGPCLHAHNGAVHRDMTDMSYQVMRLVVFAQHGKLVLPRSQTDLLANPGVDDTAWKRYLNDIQVSVDKLAALTDDPAPDGSLLAGTGIYAGYHPGGIFNTIDATDISMTVPPSKPTAGRVLGYWAQSIDSEEDDTHLWVRPTSIGGLAFAKEAWEKAWKAGMTALLAPVLCLLELFTGGSDCFSDAENMATETDFVSKVEGLIPGIGDIHGDDYTGIWHFINVQVFRWCPTTTTIARGSTTWRRLGGDRCLDRACRSIHSTWPYSS